LVEEAIVVDDKMVRRELPVNLHWPTWIFVTSTLIPTRSSTYALIAVVFGMEFEMVLSGKLEGPIDARVASDPLA